MNYLSRVFVLLVSADSEYEIPAFIDIPVIACMLVKDEMGVIVIL